jgi:16S rRNA (cytidine1402-2'-O)-methyltransferase
MASDVDREARGLPVCYNTSVGSLFLVATPIGNLEDITLRALRMLRQARLIAAEDTRQTRKLLSHFDIHTPLVSYHEHNKLTRLDQILSALAEGDVALVSDAGTPGLNDPGYELVRAALSAGHSVCPVPGPSAALAALVVSGLPTDGFVFLGYLPRRQGERRRALEGLAEEPRTLVAFEVPHRLRRALQDLEEVLGGERPVAVCRELTKMHEEILRCTLREARIHFQETDPRGEFTLVIGGAPAGAASARAGAGSAASSAAGRWPEEVVRAALAEELAEGLSPPEAARKVAAASGWERRQVYRLTVEER